MADFMDTLKQAASNIDKEDVKKVLDQALDSEIADKAIDAVEKKINKDIDKKDLKAGLDQLLK